MLRAYLGVILRGFKRFQIFESTYRQLILPKITSFFFFVLENLTKNISKHFLGLYDQVLAILTESIFNETTTKQKCYQVKVL